jgi:subfamily B ATP-binding cassette protein MsbA
MALYLRLLRRAWPYRWRIALSFTCMLLVSVLNAVSIASLQPVFDGLFGRADRLSLPPAIAGLLGDLPARISAYAQGNKIGVLTWVVGFVLVLFVVRALLSFVDVYQARWVAERIQADLREEIYSHIHSLSLSYFTRTPTGEIMARTINDTGQVGASVMDLFRNALREPFNVIGLVALMFAIDWQLALLSLIVFPAAFYPIVQFGRKMRKRGTQVLQRYTELYTLLQEAIAGVRVVKAFSMEDYERERFNTQNRKLFRAVLRSTVVDSLTHPVMESLGAIGVVLGIWVGAYFVLSGRLTPGAFLAFLGALGSLYQPIKRLCQVNNNIQQGIAGLTRIYQLLDMKSEVVERPEATPLSPIHDSVRFVGVRFRYDEEQPILNDISLEARPGDLVAIVGASGAGKTTLVNLIPRFYDPTEGAILIDGVDIRTVTLRSLREQMGIVTQETILFDDTVFNNIAYGRQDIDPGRVYEAARLANAHDFIAALPEGYATRIGERGVRLSGGERQRIAIARAILKDPPILILDEATSALDAESEHVVQEALDRVMEHRTTFVIAHRLSTVVRASKIIVLDGGTVAEIGTHEELVARGGVYARLYEIQFQAMASAEGNGR